MSVMKSHAATKFGTANQRTSDTPHLKRSAKLTHPGAKNQLTRQQKR
jgi:hypothetical protein